MRRTIILAAAICMAVAACGGDGVSETFSEIGAPLNGGGETFYDGDEGEAPADGGDAASPDSPEELDIAFAADRKVIRNVTLQLEGDDTRATYDEIVSISESLGGFVSYSEVGPTEEGQQPYILVTVRIPTAGLSEALDGFKGAAVEVVSETQGAQDVTASFIDLEAQLTNLTLLETELRALLEEVRKQPEADPAKLLQVFTEISTTRGEIERIQGQLDYLEDAVDLATVSIEIAPTPAAVPIVEEGWAPAETARDASRDLVAGLQNLVDLAITFAIAVLPMLLLAIGIPGLVLWLGYRVWRSRRAVPAAPSAPAGAE